MELPRSALLAHALVRPAARVLASKHSPTRPTARLAPPCRFCAGPAALQKAKQAGDFLLVGVHTDEEVTERRGPHLPIMALHERALSVLSCRYVDEVVIGEGGAARAGVRGCRELA